MIILASQLLSHRLYLDPGSGSILLQIVLAALLGAGVLIRSQWAKIKSLFKGKNTDLAEDDSDDEE
ncbi:MAG: hypothetical protein IPP66_09960 [Anaerolineales bacterium]|nr:hypothetical protein [Anaerolineales bacterium]